MALILGFIMSLQSPIHAAHFVASMIGHPELVEPLLRICGRESRGSKCGPMVGVHRGDARFSASAYRNAVKSGHVDPECQPYRDGQWSTRGSWGLMSAYNIHRLGVACLPPEILDIPLFSA